MNQNSTSAVERGAAGSKPAELAAAGGRSYGFLIAYLVALSAFGSFVNDMYIPTLPEMTRFFGCSASTVQLGLTLQLGLTFGMIGLGDICRSSAIVFGAMAVLIVICGYGTRRIAPDLTSTPQTK